MSISLRDNCCTFHRFNDTEPVFFYFSRFSLFLKDLLPDYLQIHCFHLHVEVIAYKYPLVFDPSAQFGYFYDFIDS